MRKAHSFGACGLKNPAPRGMEDEWNLGDQQDNAHVLAACAPVARISTPLRVLVVGSRAHASERSYRHISAVRAAETGPHDRDTTPKVPTIEGVPAPSFAP
jgi:hypothetical protein